MFRSMRASRIQEFLHLRLPSALPVTFAGLKIGMTLALIGAVVGEFISAEKGLGLLLIQFSSQAGMADAMAVLAMLTLIGLVLYVTMEVLDRAVVFWYHDGRMAARSRRRAARSQRRKGRTGQTPPAVRANANARGGRPSADELGALSRTRLEEEI
jgi:NitT/TauT family transport system permease protein